MQINKLKFPVQAQKGKVIHQKTQQFSPYDRTYERRHSQRGKQILVPIEKLTHRQGFRITKPLKSETKSTQKDKDFNKRVAAVDLYSLKNSLLMKKERQSYEFVGTKKKSSTNRMVTQKLKTKEPQHLEKALSIQKQRQSIRKILPRQQTLKQSPGKNIIRMVERKNQIFDQSPEKYNSNQLKKTRRSSQKKLTPFEKQESANYEVFFIGNRRIYNKTDFTDHEGDPKVLIGDSIAYKYQIISNLGRGSFGKVFKVYDHKKKQYVALKIIKAQQKFINQAKIEVQILENALLHDPKLRCNLVRMKNSFQFRGHACITFQILHKNLYEFLKETNFAGFSLDLIRRFAIQILQTLMFFSFFKIIHCDLKPQNILLKEQNKSGIKVIDVGSGCFQTKQLYTYIQSRFYRAPQIILGIKYTAAIDMWSFGCILAQLYTGFPVFPGESQNEQMLMFMELLGVPPYSMLEVAQRRRKFFTQNFQCKIPQQKGKQRIIKSLTLKEVIGDCDPQFLNLLQRCLQWDPKKRITPKEALLHNWIINGLPVAIRAQHIEQVNNYSVR